MMNWIETPTKLFISDLNKHEYHSDEYCHGLSYSLTKCCCTSRLPTRILAQIFGQYSNQRNTVRKVANILRKFHLLSTEVQHVGMQKSSQILTYCPKFLNGLVILQQKCWNYQQHTIRSLQSLYRSLSLHR